MRTKLLHDEGSGPVLVYVPGIDASGELLLETAERLREHYRLVQVWYPTQGDPKLTSLDDIAAGVFTVLDELGIERATLLAESFGVSVALSCALLQPERVNALALVNGFAYYPRRTSIALSKFFSWLLPEGVFSFLRPRLAKSKLFGQLCEADALARFKDRSMPRFDAGYRERLNLITALDLRPRLGEIHVPVALFASEDDHIVPSVPCAKEMHAALPNSTLRIIPRGGHVVLPLQSLPWLEWIAEIEARHATPAQ